MLKLSLNPFPLTIMRHFKFVTIAALLVSSNALASDRDMMVRSELLPDTRETIAQKKGAAKELERLCRAADKLLGQPFVSVIDKPAPGPSGDKHDYLSLATYYWPNPNTPNGLPYVGRDGETNPEIHEYDISRLNRMCEAVQTLTLAFHFTGQEQYAERAAQQLRVWFLDGKTKMNPNLTYAQMVKGKGHEGMPYGLIDSRRLIMMGDAMRILQKSKSWTQEDQVGMKKWFEDYLHWMLTSNLGKREGEAENNHGVWYDVQVAAYSLFCGKTDLARNILEQAKTKRIAQQVEPDGSQPRELARTKSLTYVLFNLNAMVSLAMLGDQVGVDLWNYADTKGRGIRRALEWVIPYAKGEKTWEHQQIGQVKDEDFAPLVGLLRQASAAYHDPAYESIIAGLKNVDNARERADLLWPSHLAH